MKNKKIFFYTALVSISTIVFFLLLPVFAQEPSFYTQATNISCGNNVCEETRQDLKIGETKNFSFGGKNFSLKLADVKIIPVTYTQEDGSEHTAYNQEFYFSVNGSKPLLEGDAERQYGIDFDVSFVYSEQAQGQSTPEVSYVTVAFREDKVCAVPDCADRVESKVSKGWNLVPIYFIIGLFSDDLEKSLAVGTCKMQYFQVIYAYNPEEKNYVKLYAFGKSYNDNGSLGDSSSNNPLLSVWIYSNQECKLVTELPKLFSENLLLILASIADQKPPPLQFVPGWNFFAGSNDMAAKSFEEIRGTCDIKAAYTFDSPTQNWKKLDRPPPAGESFVIKVASACMLGYPEIAPPELPTGASVLYNEWFKNFKKS